MKAIAEVYWDKGMRESNQDSVSLQEVRMGRKKVLFALVCDGIGGLQEGETASGLVAEQMTQWFYEEGVEMLRRHKSQRKIQKAGLRALYGCNEALKSYGTKHGVRLGTTATVLLLWDGKYILWHSGDTRAYCIKTGIRSYLRTCLRIKRICRWKQQEGMRQLTMDHTVDNHTLVQCVGSFAWKEPEVIKGRLWGSNTLLLCSDGFRNRVRGKQIEEALHPAYLQSGEQIRMRLRELAEYGKRQGEKDNISAVAVRVN